MHLFYFIAHKTMQFGNKIKLNIDFIAAFILFIAGLVSCAIK